MAADSKLKQIILAVAAIQVAVAAEVKFMIKSFYKLFIFNYSFEGALSFSAFQGNISDKQIFNCGIKFLDV
jgi:hypothetical protein